MKILQINTTVNTTSTGRIAEEIGQTLQVAGHESYIAYKNAGPMGSHSNLIKIGNKLDVYMHVLKTRLLDRHGFGSKYSTENLVNKIEQIDPDVIGLHNLHGYYLNIDILFNYLKQVQKPVVWTFHDCWPFTGHCCFFDYVGCEKWKTESGCQNCPLYDKYPASWYVDNSANNFHRKKELFNGLESLTIVTPSHWLKRLVGQSFLSDYQVKVIHNGINLDRFKPVCTDELDSKYGLVDKKILLGVASVWDRRKGLKYFVELSKKLDDSFRIVLIGLTQKTIKRLPKNIIGIERTENIDELVAYYSMADVFVNPTLVDNFPTTNLEALACGTPVVTFDTGGSPEAIDDETGFVVDKKDVDQLNQAISQCTQNSKNGYQRKCRDRAVRYFDKDDRYGEYADLYKSMRPKPEANLI